MEKPRVKQEDIEKLESFWNDYEKNIRQTIK